SRRRHTIWPRDWSSDVCSSDLISAFPVEAIKPAQTLVGDLGFDSLMTVELDGDVTKAFPAVGGLPRSLLGAQTTVQDVIDHVERSEERREGKGCRGGGCRCQSR